MKKGKSLLSKKQKRLLSLFSENKPLRGAFYLTGGTALAAFYIPYRYSEDLDFFSEDEVDPALLVVFLKSIKEKLGYEEFDLNTSFNRNLLQLKFKDEVLKLEFTYFPFPQIETPQTKDGVKVDSVLDIATNKLFTIYQNPRSRDFMDLYMICRKYEYTIEGLIEKAKIKFDWHVDPIKLGSQFLLVEELKDYPRLMVALDHREWQDFFIAEAKKLSLRIFE